MMAAGQMIQVSSDARVRLTIYADLIVKWQRSINLVGSATLPDLWNRHIADSLQLQTYAGTWRHWVDLGSGAGFPGMVIALTSDHEACVHLIESDKRKAAFLREVSRETQANVEIHCGRIERILPELATSTPIDVVSARALASLENLISYASPALDKGACGLFLKGKDARSELTPAVAASSVNITFAASQTESGALIVIVRRQSSLTNFALRS